MNVPVTPAPPRGFTLLELTVVLCVLLVLIGIGVYATGGTGDWKKGRVASEQLRTVYVAQRMYLADNPATKVDTLTAAQLVPYLPGNPGQMPVIQALDSQPLAIRVNVSPPVVTAGNAANGTPYDPSGSANDSLWDVGE